MTEEEFGQLKQAYTNLKEEMREKDRRIEELEGQLMGALLRIEELERRLAKDSHNSGSLLTVERSSFSFSAHSWLLVGWGKVVRCHGEKSSLNKLPIVANRLRVMI